MFYKGVQENCVLIGYTCLKGAEIIYTRFLRPRLLEAQNDIDKGADRLRQKVGDAVSDITSKQD